MTTGSYILIIYIGKNLNSVAMGRLSNLTFKKGFYLYIGSAMGAARSSTSLERRVYHHIQVYSNRKTKFTPHWHIDHLLLLKEVSLNKVLIIPSDEKEECKISQWIAENSNGLIKGFGSSDCMCESHLYYFSEDNSFV